MSKVVDLLRSKKFVNTLVLLCIFYVFSFLVLMFCSQSSFLYACNDWADLNWYITMGKGILAGKLPYKDLFEQKGPVLYFVFALVALFKNAYIGAFLLETITMCAYLFVAYKFASLFLKNHAYSLISAMVLGLMTATSFAFGKGGGAVEEYALPILMYFVLCYFEYTQGKEFTKTRSFLIGFWISVLFWVKYTLILLPAIMLVFYAILSIIKKQYKTCLINLLFVLLGTLSLSAVIILIFLCCGGIKFLFSNYFYDNLFRYTKAIDSNVMSSVLNHFMTSIHIFFFNFFGLLFYILKNKKKSLPFALFAVVYIVFQAVISKFYYYTLPLCMFTCLGTIMLFSFAEKFDFKFKKIVCGVAAVGIFAFSILFGYLFSNVKHELSRPAEDYPAYKIAAKIKSFNLENPTLLCYCYDHGIYTRLGIIPEQRFYATNNFDMDEYPELYESFRESIKNRKTDFLVVNYHFFDSDQELIEENYVMVEKFESYSWASKKEVEVKFCLLIKKEFASLI